MDHPPANSQLLAQAREASVAGHPHGPALPAARSRVGRRAGLRGVPPRLTSAELIAAGVSAELLVSLALRRASSGQIAKSGDHYYDRGHPMPSYLTHTLDELTDSGLLTLTEDVSGMRRCHLTDAGNTRYAQLTRCPNPRAEARRGRLASQLPLGGVCGALVLTIDR